jgi:hypothetical protein
LSQLDVEWVAFRAGLKPALRLSASASEATAMAARYRAAGAHVVEAAGWVKTAAELRVLLYVAATRDAAQALQAAEAPTLQGEGVCGREQSVRCARRVGELLGYPRCCVEAFCARMQRGIGRLRDGRRAVEPYVAAVEAWRERPHPWLNNLRRPERVQLVSFEPCAYDCAAALEQAGRCHGAAHSFDPPGVRQLERELAAPVAIAASGARALVVLAGGRIVNGRGAEGDARTAGEGGALAEQLLGAAVSAAGVVPHGDGPPVLVCDFSRAASAYSSMRSGR